jgi:methylenetetrahydrofolate reductase (NADPH)
MRIADRLAHKRPVFSFEFFPPKTEAGEVVLWKSLEQLAKLRPDYVSVTYGAGGSTRSRTIELVGRIKRELGIEAMAHLTCVGSTRDEIAEILDRLGELGIENVLALRGDPPKGADRFEAVAGGFSHGTELVAFIRERYGDQFCVGAACYPEVHPEAASAEADMDHLVEKVNAGVDFLVSQLFFDNGSFAGFCERAQAAGIEVPIVAGIMPVTNVKQIQRFATMCGASFPERFAEHLHTIEDDPQEVFWAGVQYAAHQCRQLLEPTREDVFGDTPLGVPGIHFYTLNKSPASRAIFEILQLTRSAL